MLRRHFFLIVAAAFFAHAVPTHAQADAALSADVTVKQATDRVIAAIDAGRANYETDPAPLRTELRTVLADYVAFDAISRGVLGKHRGALDAEQSARFTDLFAASIVDLYADALVALKAEEINVQPAKSKKPGRATVKMDVRSDDGKRFELQYSLAQKDGEPWRIRNIIVEGINLGLTYRNQFDALMQEMGGDVENVLAVWRERSSEAT